MPEPRVADRVIVRVGCFDGVAGTIEKTAGRPLVRSLLVHLDEIVAGQPPGDRWYDLSEVDAEPSPR